MKLPTTTAVSRPAVPQTSWQLKPFDFHAPTRVDIFDAVPERVALRCSP